MKDIDIKYALKSGNNLNNLYLNDHHFHLMIILVR